MEYTLVPGYELLKENFRYYIGTESKYYFYGTNQFKKISKQELIIPESSENNNWGRITVNNKPIALYEKNNNKIYKLESPFHLFIYNQEDKSIDLSSSLSLSLQEENLQNSNENINQIVETHNYKLVTEIEGNNTIPVFEYKRVYCKSININEEIDENTVFDFKFYQIPDEQNNISYSYTKTPDSRSTKREHYISDGVNENEDGCFLFKNNLSGQASDKNHVRTKYLYGVKIGNSWYKENLQDKDFEQGVFLINNNYYYDNINALSFYEIEYQGKPYINNETEEADLKRIILSKVPYEMIALESKQTEGAETYQYDLCDPYYIQDENGNIIKGIPKTYDVTLQNVQLGNTNLLLQFAQLNFNNNCTYLYDIPCKSWEKFFPYKLGDIVEYKNRYYKCNISNYKKYANHIFQFPFNLFNPLEDEELYPKTLWLLTGVKYDESISELKDISVLKYLYNKSFYTDGGWEHSDIRTYLNTTIFKMLPLNLQQKIKSIKVPCTKNIGNMITNEQFLPGTHTTDKLFLLSSQEVASNRSYGYYFAQEGTTLLELPTVLQKSLNDNLWPLNNEGQPYYSFTRTTISNRRSVPSFAPSTENKITNSRTIINSNSSFLCFAFCL